MDLYEILERVIKCEREAESTGTRHQRQCQCHSLFVLVNTHTHTHLGRQNLVLCILNIYEKLSATLAWPICNTDRQTDICMYKQLSFPWQAGCKHFSLSLYHSPSRLCWLCPEELANRMQIIIQHDPQTHMYAKLWPVPTIVLRIIAWIWTY